MSHLQTEVNLHRLLDGRLDIVLGGHARVEDLDGERAAGDPEAGRRAAEEVRELFGVHRRRRHDELEVGAARQHLQQIESNHQIKSSNRITHISEQAKEHVGIEGALVRLVHDDARILIDILVAEALSQ